MKHWLLPALLGLVVVLLSLSRVASAQPVTIYNTFGPGDAFDASNANDVAGPLVPIGNPSSPAFPFTPDLTATFEMAQMPLRYGPFGSGPNRFQVQIRSDQDGLPDGVLETIEVIDLPSFGGPQIVSAASVLHPLLEAGKNYWLAILPATENTFGGWYMTVPFQQGDKAVTPNLGLTWRLNEFGRQSISAFRITGVAIPEPAALGLLGLGVFGLFGHRLGLARR